MSSSVPNPRPVHQLVNNLSPGDAIGHDVLAIQTRLRQRGHPSEIFCLHAGPGMAKRAKPASAYSGFSSPNNAVIWHFSIGTPLAEMAASLSEPVIMRYHNVTPAHFFKGVSHQIERECRLGRQQLVAAARFVALAIGDSAFNQAELDQLGYLNTGNCPILINMAAYCPANPPARLSHLVQGGPNILHVGRFMPQKRYEDLIKVLYFLVKIKPSARLILVGGDEGLETYRQALEGLAADLGLSRRVIFSGKVSQAELMAYFSLAQVYLCLSDHEGFCLPLIEAMTLGLPVVAKRSTAVTETLGEAGLLLDDPSPAQTAEALAALTDDPALGETIVTGQRSRLLYFQPDRVWARLSGLLRPFIEDQ
ncbi:MAG: glycosyltransferase family 4 protein [Deltaproteobacteria bacterium]|nr:glycosyltransferase family 4 protein [Deltaproteobacteria bacterium]